MLFTMNVDCGVTAIFIYGWQNKALLEEGAT